MPSRERIAVLYKALLDAALDQEKPSKELKQAINSLLLANTAALREAPPTYGSEEELSKPVEMDN